MGLIIGLVCGIVIGVFFADDIKDFFEHLGE